MSDHTIHDRRAAHARRAAERSGNPDYSQRVVNPDGSVDLHFNATTSDMMREHFLPAMQDLGPDATLGDVIDDMTDGHGFAAIAFPWLAGVLANPHNSRYDKAWAVTVLHEGFLMLSSDNVQVRSFQDVEDFREVWQAAYRAIHADPTIPGPVDATAQPHSFDPATYDADVYDMAANLLQAPGSPHDSVSLITKVIDFVDDLPYRDHSLFWANDGDEDVEDVEDVDAWDLVSVLTELADLLLNTASSLDLTDPRQRAGLAEAIDNVCVMFDGPDDVSELGVLMAPLAEMMKSLRAVPGQGVPVTVIAAHAPVDNRVRRRVARLLMVLDTNTSDSVSEVVDLHREWGSDLDVTMPVAAWAMTAVTAHAVTTGIGLTAVLPWAHQVHDTTPTS